ncbi:bestrophin family protein [Leptolyngbya ohadii]|uniref:bestrophin family protein n=1 Tax=Leptolyngbya ohadii TaxID=1962290 RepID=UPI000B59FA67|nr:bestrophin family ion channel [Leptolyngbya ohadii]
MGKVQQSQQTWFHLALRLKGSVIPAVLPRTLVCGAFSIAVVLLDHLGYPVSLPVLAGVIPNVVLGLMLVFRTNTAYERFWEGRKLWGNLVNATRNLARQIWVSVIEKDLQDRQHKEIILSLLAAFSVAMKRHLRQESVNEELEKLMPHAEYATLKTLHNPPLEIAFWIQDYLQHQYQRDCLNIYQFSQMERSLNAMVDCLGGCERILKTPMPLAYAIHLKQVLLIYGLTLPFQFVAELHGWTVAIVILISFIMFGIEEIGIEIENPFGHDPNDLPLDTICAAIQQNIQELMLLEPNSNLRRQGNYYVSKAGIEQS